VIFRLKPTVLRTNLQAKGVRGLTLIELIFLIAIITLMIATVIPLISRSRENARTTACKYNLKQIAEANLSYTSAAGYLPPGYFWAVRGGAGQQRGFEISHGPLVSLLPFLEEQKTYQAINFNCNIYSAANFSVCQQKISLFVCPADRIAMAENLLPNHRISDIPEELKNGVHPVPRANYAGVVGPWVINTWKISSESIGERATFGDAQQAQLGLFNASSSVRMESIRDGASTTIAFGEHTLLQVPENQRADSHWWFSGTHGDTLISTMFPINAVARKLSDETVGAISASSAHLNKANFALMDGSVRTIRDSISSFASDASAAPAGGNGQPHPQLWINSDTEADSIGPDPYWDIIFKLKKGKRFGLYQALSTRAGSEQIAEDF
jgi:prepilin-type processing-associated H-X9-DG protein